MRLKSPDTDELRCDYLNADNGQEAAVELIHEHVTGGRHVRHGPGVSHDVVLELPRIERLINIDRITAVVRVIHIAPDLRPANHDVIPVAAVMRYASRDR